MTTTANRQAGETIAAARPAARRIGWLVAGLVSLPLVIFRAGVLAEGDTFWQIRTGLLTIAHRSIPRTDTFSWTAHGKPYFQNSWGFDVLLGGAFRVAGLPGVALLCALITLAAVAVMLLLARTLGASPGASATVFFIGLPLLISWLSARAQLVDYVAVPLLAMLLRGIEQGHRRWGAAALTGLLTVVWVNLHAAALLAVAIAGASAVLLLLARRAAGWRYAAAAAAVAAAACLANPYGIGLLHEASQVRADSAGLIIEWTPFNPGHPVQDLTMAAGLVALIIVWRRRELVLTAALAVCMAGSVDAERFQPFVVILAMPVLAAAVRSGLPDPIRRYLVSRRVMFQRCGALGLAALVALTLPSVTHIGRPDPSIYPAAVVADIPHGCRLFTTDLLGDYVILARPDVPVSLDGRNNLYGPVLLVAEEKVLHGIGDLSRGLAGAGCVLVPPSYGLAPRLRHDPQWQLRAADRAAVLYVRR